MRISIGSEGCECCYEDCDCGCVENCPYSICRNTVAGYLTDKDLYDNFTKSTVTEEQVLSAISRLINKFCSDACGDEHTLQCINARLAHCFVAGRFAGGG